MTTALVTTVLHGHSRAVFADGADAHSTFALDVLDK